jgi:hypothetical protein
MMTHEQAEHKTARSQSIVASCIDLIEHGKDNSIIDQLLALLELLQNELLDIHNWIEGTEFPPMAGKAA